MPNHRPTALRMFQLRDRISSQHSTTRLYTIVPNPQNPDTELITQVLNEGTTLTPRIEQIAANQAYKLFPNADLQSEGLNLYHARVIGKSLSNKVKYALSLDDGVSAFLCKLYGIKSHTTNAAQILILGAKPNTVFELPP